MTHTDNPESGLTAQPPGHGCGHEVKPGVRFCTVCGRPVADDNRPVVAQPESAYPEAPATVIREPAERPFDDPVSQTPAVLCRLAQNDVAAYSRVCTHAGCLVDFDSGSGVLFCPCHGAEFDPAHGARVIQGPAPVPLPSIPVQIDQSTGKVVVTG